LQNSFSNSFDPTLHKPTQTESLTRALTLQLADSQLKKSGAPQLHNASAKQQAAAASESRGRRFSAALFCAEH
jgi:hypothetical protein